MAATRDQGHNFSNPKMLIYAYLSTVFNWHPYFIGLKSKTIVSNNITLDFISYSVWIIHMCDLYIVTYVEAHPGPKKSIASHDENIPVTAEPQPVTAHWDPCPRLVYVDLTSLSHSADRLYACAALSLLNINQRSYFVYLFWSKTVSPVDINHWIIGILG